MVIFEGQDSQENFELGTSPTSVMVLESQEGNSVPADLIIDSGEEISAVTIEVINATTDEVLITETDMERVSNADQTNAQFDASGFEDTEFAYYKTFTIPEDAEEGQYYLVHRATVGGEEYKRTAIINVVDVYEEYV